MDLVTCLLCNPEYFAADTHVQAEDHPMDSGMAFMGDSEAFMDVEPSQSYNPQIPSEPRTSVSQAGGIAEAGEQSTPLAGW